MYPVIRKILAIVVGWFSGSIINLGLIQLGHIIFPIKNVDTSDMDALAQVMPTLTGEYFIFPFLAHALGTLAGALIAGIIAENRKMTFAMIVGALFLLGGIMVNYILPGPTWFTALDIIVAYIPMAWLGGKMAIKLAEKIKWKKNNTN
ncbi:hypothetical protein [Winogradskyella sp. A3E31]|uniref:hypothetical protein n=1 Tax=Winogradskyella sp. A3E31 TaxID=3349637 RepID=UPI00398A99CB